MIKQTSEDGEAVQRLKHCEYNNQDEHVCSNSEFWIRQTTEGRNAIIIKINTLARIVRYYK